MLNDVRGTLAPVAAGAHGVVEMDVTSPESIAAAFETARAAFPGVPASLAASSGIFLGRPYLCDLVRPGMALYGANPVPGTANPMRAVVRLAARILQVRELETGATIGYGATHRVAGPARIATIAAGYADGLLRSLSNRGSAVLDGHTVPFVGRVSMDLITLDVTAVAPGLARPGAFVELIGERTRIDDVAGAAGTIAYEVLTSLGRRYHRIYRGAP
jgi:alanine racemase